MTQNSKIYREYLESLFDRGSLTKWEDSFCVGLVDQLDHGRILSERQVEILERIYRDKTQ